MTDTITAVDNDLTFTAFFGRKISDGNYGSKEASLFVQFKAPADTPLEVIQTKAQLALVAAETVVLEQLHIPYELDDDGKIAEGIVVPPKPAVARENLPGLTPQARDAVTQIRDTFGGGTVVDPDSAEGQYVSAPQVDPKDMSPAEQKKWAMRRYQEDPSQFWDNRIGKRNPKGPDFKHKTTGIGLWLGDMQKAGIAVAA